MQCIKVIVKGKLKCLWFRVCVCGVFRCRRTSVWTPSNRLCREWPSPFTKTLLQHLNIIGTRKSTTYNWWVLKSKSFSVTFAKSIIWISKSALCISMFIVRWDSEVCGRELFTDRHNEVLILPKKGFVFLIEMQWVHVTWSDQCKVQWNDCRCFVSIPFVFATLKAFQESSMFCSICPLTVCSTTQ